MTARVGVELPEIATVLYFPPVISPVVSAIVTAEFCISFQVVASNLATALSVAEAGHTTSPVPQPHPPQPSASIAIIFSSTVVTQSYAISAAVSAHVSLKSLIIEFLSTRANQLSVIVVIFF